jgi:glycolate oxidase FAD binding subunit
MEEATARLAETIRDAAARGQPLRIRGGGTKDFYGEAPRGEVLDTSAHQGIIDYDPTELVLTARCGTPLVEIERAMQSEGQMLGFEPPRFGSGATFGGCLAAGLSGPRRPFAGAVRDFVLGVRLLDGQGTDLRFGGRVMKNVAGYDLSRLSVAALGTLGVILEASIKALPLPRAETTVWLEMSQAEAIRTMNTWAGRPLPISATCHVGNRLFVRLSGAVPAVEAARSKVGGERVSDADRFWTDLREHRLEHFATTGALWRVSVQPTTPPLELAGPQIVEWNGALRWIAADLEASTVRAAAARAGGHATLFRGANKVAGAFHPLAPPMLAVHKRLKSVFDPRGILNPGRLYPDL